MPVRRIIAVLIAALIAALAVSACSGSSGSTPTTTAAPATTAAPTTTAPATTAAPTTTVPTTVPATTAAPSTTVAPTTTADPGHAIHIEVVDGHPGDGLQRVDVPLGAEVTITLVVDHADEFHLHAYDLRADLSPGVSTALEFTAEIPGVFEGELHHDGLVVLALTVS